MNPSIKSTFGSSASVTVFPATPTPANVEETVPPFVESLPGRPLSGDSVNGEISEHLLPPDELSSDELLPGEPPRVEPVQPDPLKLSATRLKTYLTCPRQYRYRYVDELPGILTGALAFGQVMHQVIHDLHRWSLCSNEPLHYGVALSNFARLWEKTIIEDEPVLHDEAEIAGYARLAEIILRGYVEAHRDKPQPFVLEFPFDLELEEANTGQPYMLSGTIDRIDRTEAGLVIVDFKTGKRKPSPRELAFDTELTICAYAAREIFGQEIVDVQLYHLRDQTVFHTRRGVADTRTLLQVIVPEVVEGITARHFAPKLGYWCRYCEFKEQCLVEGPDQAPQPA